MGVYLQHFGLNERPFRIVPSPRYFFVSETHDEGRARILYGIRENRGFVVVTGGVGLGKTTVLLSVVNELEPEMDVAIVVNPIDSFEQLLRMICEELGVTVRDADEGTLMAHLNTALLASYAKGRGCVLMLDEAQNLSIEVLEKVRTLSNLQTEDASLLQIVLVGQPELTAKLNDHRLRQLRQRIGVWHEIRELSLDDTTDYMWHRLALSGAPDPRAVIPARSARMIHRYSQGIPRLINQLCDTGLVVAYGEGSRHVEPHHVQEAARELRLDGADQTYVPSEKREQGEAAAGRRRWLIAALIGIVVIVITGAAWKQYGLSFGAGLLPGNADAGLEPASSGSAEVAAAAAPVETVVEAAADPAPSRTADVAAVLPAYREVEKLRSAGVVYTVHLRSFRSMEAAESYAAELRSDPNAWTEPLYVEETLDRPAWFRVTAGGYTERARAIAKARRLKSDFGLAHTQLDRLDADAWALLPGGPRNAEDFAHHE